MSFSIIIAFAYHFHTLLRKFDVKWYLWDKNTIYDHTEFRWVFAGVKAVDGFI